MTTQKAIERIGACRITASVFGVLAGIGGLTHGVGEVLQGNVAIDGIALDSWTTGPIARYMGGEPGITLMPTALAAGVVTLVLSIAVAAWAILGVRASRFGLVLAVLSAGMLLAGGGVGPPVIGMLAGAVGRWGPDRQPPRVERLSDRTRRLLASAWKPLFAIAAANGVFLVLGSLILVYTINLNAPAMFEYSFYLSVLMLLALLLTAPIYDAQARHPAQLTGSDPLRPSKRADHVRI